MMSKSSLRWYLTAAITLENQPKISRTKNSPSLYTDEGGSVTFVPVFVWKNSPGVKNYITQDPSYPQDPSRKKSTHSPHRHWSVWLRQKWTAGLCDADRACFHSSPKRSVLPRPGAAIRSPAGWGLSVGQYIVRLSRFPLEARRDGEKASFKHRSII